EQPLLFPPLHVFRQRRIHRFALSPVPPHLLGFRKQTVVNGQMRRHRHYSPHNSLPPLVCRINGSPTLQPIPPPSFRTSRFAAACPLRTTARPGERSVRSCLAVSVRGMVLSR